MAQVLGLEDNAISSWQEVLRLAGLPNLQRLVLSGNPISSITYPANAIRTAALFSTSPPDPAGPSGQPQPQATAPTPAGGTASCQQQQQAQLEEQRPFARLQGLLLADCRLSSWSDVDQLDRFPALRELRLSGNPLFSAEGCGAGGGRRFEVSASDTPGWRGRWCSGETHCRQRKLLHNPHTAGWAPASQWIAAAVVWRVCVLLLCAGDRPRVWADAAERRRRQAA